MTPDPCLVIPDPYLVVPGPLSPAAIPDLVQTCSVIPAFDPSQYPSPVISDPSPVISGSQPAIPFSTQAL